MTIVACAVCGKKNTVKEMILRRLNNREHFCCGISCEVKWEKQNLMGVCG